MVIQARNLATTPRDHSLPVTAGAGAVRGRSPVLVAGLPRSGTSWVGRALAAGEGIRYVSEPDNEDGFAYAIRAKRGLGYLPLIPPGGTPPNGYRRLWAAVLGDPPVPPRLRHRVSRRLHRAARGSSSVHDLAGWPLSRRALLGAAVALAAPGPVPAGQRVVVKSVYAPLALRWIADTWSPAVVVVVRNALNTVASWRQLGWGPPLVEHPVLGGPDPDATLAALAGCAPGRPMPPPPEPRDTVARLTWELSALLTVMLQVTAEDAVALLLQLADLCADPIGRFRALYQRLDLPWSATVERHLAGSDRPGSGAYTTTRVASEEPERWRHRLDPEDARTVRSVADRFELAERFGVQW